MPRFSGCDAGNAADAEERHRDRDLRPLGERNERLSVALDEDDAVARQNRSAVRRLLISSSAAESGRLIGTRSGRACGWGVAASQSNSHERLLRVLRDVDEHRARTADSRRSRTLRGPPARRSSARVTR